MGYIRRPSPCNGVNAAAGQQRLVGVRMLRVGRVAWHMCNHRLPPRQVPRDKRQRPHVVHGWPLWQLRRHTHRCLTIFLITAKIQTPNNKKKKKKKKTPPKKKKKKKKKKK